MSETISNRALNRAFLARQMLLEREKTTVRKAIARLVAMQAQIPKPPFIGLWTRVAGFKREDLIRQVRAGKVVRATTLRATLHLMTADDYCAFRGTIQAALDRGMRPGSRLGTVELADLCAAGRKFFAAPATFDSLRTHLETLYPKAGDVRGMAYVVRLRVPLLQLHDDSDWGWPAKATFGLPEKTHGMKMPAAQTPAEKLVLRYLAAYGPATVADAQNWSAMPSLKAAFEKLRPKLITMREGKRELFDLPDAPRPDEDTTAPVRYIPEYDNLVLSHQDRTRIIADDHRKRVLTANLQVRSTFLVDGFVAGTWKIERKKDLATLVLEPFVKIAKKTASQLEEEGERLVAFAEPDAGRRAISLKPA